MLINSEEMTLTHQGFLILGPPDNAFVIRMEDIRAIKTYPTNPSLGGRDLHVSLTVVFGGASESEVVELYGAQAKQVVVLVKVMKESGLEMAREIERHALANAMENSGGVQ